MDRRRCGFLGRMMGYWMSSKTLPSAAAISTIHRVALVPQVKTRCAGIRSSYGVSVKMNVKVAGQPLSTAVLLGRGFT